MRELLDWLISKNGFMPRTQCGPAWTDELVAMHRWSDWIIFGAYVAIPFALVASLRARRTLTNPTRTGAVLYALFIVSCGVTHLTNSLMFTEPVYRLDALAKVVCATFSVAATLWTYLGRARW